MKQRTRTILVTSAIWVCPALVAGVASGPPEVTGVSVALLSLASLGALVAFLIWMSRRLAEESPAPAADAPDESSAAATSEGGLPTAADEAGGEEGPEAPTESTPGSESAATAEAKPETSTDGAPGSAAVVAPAAEPESAAERRHRDPGRRGHGGRGHGGRGHGGSGHGRRVHDRRAAGASPRLSRTTRHDWQVASDALAYAIAAGTEVGGVSATFHAQLARDVATMEAWLKRQVPVPQHRLCDQAVHGPRRGKAQAQLRQWGADQVAGRASRYAQVLDAAKPYVV